MVHSVQYVRSLKGVFNGVVCELWPRVGDGLRSASAAISSSPVTPIGAACKECQLKSKCTKSAFRRVLRYVDEAILERMAERLAARPELLDARRESVEHPFGSIKQWMGQGAFLTRRLENVRGEFSITALAYNIRRAISLAGVPALIAAARA